MTDGNTTNAFVGIGDGVPADRIELRADAVDEMLVMRQLITALNAKGDHRRVFQYGGNAAVISRSRSVVLRSVKNGVEEVTRSIPKLANDGLLRGPISQVSTWVKFYRTPAPGEDRTVKIPPWITKLIIDNFGEGLKPLAGIADFPVISSTGQLLCGSMGYEPISRLYVDCPAVTMDKNQFEGDPRAAYKWIRDNMLVEFPFASEEDLARAISIPLTIMNRRTRIVDGAPIPMITSPTPETGKTLLARALVECVTGQTLAVSAWDHDSDQERRKTLLSIGLENPPAVLFDNIRNGWAVEDATLDKYITSDSYSDRILGKNETAQVPATTYPMFTGNNITAASIDLLSRMFEVRLEKPASRKPFKNKNLMEWIHKNRTTIIQALFTIGTAKVRGEYTPVSRFPAWGEIVGARVQYAADNKGVWDCWKEDVSRTINEDLEGLLYAMVNAKDGNRNEYGYKPGEMSKLFSTKMAELEPEMTSKWMKMDDRMILFGEIPPRSVHSVLKKYRGHMAGKWRLEIVLKENMDRPDRRKTHHFKALEV